ncbi:MAG: DUF418 domain-containing protein [Bacteroidales bacterium]|nr:DUF418 domain-containing protein [Bacteroidales bacterium]
METQEQINAQEIPKPKAEPVLLRERVGSIDAIRGFALLGILIVNMIAFSGPPGIYFSLVSTSGTWTNFWDIAASNFISFFVQGKFYTIFAFLFGLGFAIFYERAKEKTGKPIRLFYKRLLILLLIGLIHAFFVWSGDVLVYYAVLGFLLPLFFNRKPKTLLRWAGAIFFSIVILSLLGIMALGIDKNMLASAVNEHQIFLADIKMRIANSVQAYGSGTFAEIQAQRVSETLFMFQHGFATAIFVIFPLFLLGLYAGKKGFFQNVAENISTIKKMQIWGLVVGLVLSTIKFMVVDLAITDPYSFYAVIHLVSSIFGDLGLAVFFMATIIRLYQNKNWMQRLVPLAYTGRMALSNYLFQSIICTFIFYNFGLGLFGQVGPAIGLALAIVIFTGQVYVSKFWLQRYQYGPVEWLWKSLTYGKLFRMKLPNNA